MMKIIGPDEQSWTETSTLTVSAAPQSCSPSERVPARKPLQFSDVAALLSAVLGAAGVVISPPAGLAAAIVGTLIAGIWWLVQRSNDSAGKLAMAFSRSAQLQRKEQR